MFEPVRGGTRGGQAEFKWSDVSADKDRENYLGHSINAPTGRWQKNKDVHWYSRDVDQGAAERAEEIRKIKEAEADALSVALGFAPADKKVGSTTATGASPTASTTVSKPDAQELARSLEKEDRRLRKAQRKEEKRAKKEIRRAERSARHHTDDERPGRRDRSRSRSPQRHRPIDQGADIPRHSRYRTRSRSPPRSERRSRSRGDTDYDASRRERDRERDRRLWDLNSRRERPSGDRWGR